MTEVIDITEVNLALWQSVERTDPKHVKGITGKSYQGNSPKPYYLVHKATETFGPCGIGWGFTIEDERIEEGAGGERMSIARVKVWFKWDGERGEVEHIGGTSFSGIRASGKPFTDEDAPKKSVTDALVKALSMIGFAGDIFMGRYDDSKYVAEVREEFSARPSAPPEVDETYSPPPRKANGLPEVGWREDGSRTSFWLNKNGTIEDLRKELFDDAVDCHSMRQLTDLKAIYRGKAREAKLNRQFLDVLTEEFAFIERRIMDAMDAAELAEIPLGDALKKSLSQHPLTAG